MMMLKLYFVMLLVIKFTVTDEVNDNEDEVEVETVLTDEVMTLSELPMDKLLHVKRAFIPDTSYSDVDMEATSRMLEADTPEALHLVSHPHGRLQGPPKEPVKRGMLLNKGGGGGGGKGGGKDKSTVLSSIFGLSVTILTFLAFGLYLLCIIIQCFKNMKSDSNGNSTVMINMSGMPMVNVPGGPGGIDINVPGGGPGGIDVDIMGRKKREARYNSSRDAGPYWPNVNMEDMYRALIMVAEGYSHYHDEL